MNTFENFGLLSTINKTLKDSNIFKPTEIQNTAIPLLLSKQSVVGISETGSGKTLAYVLPILQQLKNYELNSESVQKEASPRAVIMVPTRELGEQVSKVFKAYTHETRLRVRTALGGTKLEQARRNTSGVFEILLATPGRLVQLINTNEIIMSDVKILVFDEADQMMDQGFLSDSNQIYYACPKDVQLVLFSATISTAVQDLINNLFQSAEVIRTSASGKVSKNLKTENIIVKDGNRWEQLRKILSKPIEGGTILFSNTREQCDKLAKEMEEKGFDVSIYRGEMEKNERRANLKKFINNEVKYLVATDLGGRGLDIPQVDRVINFHLPRQLENYLHRVGRTARAGRKGTVINLVTEKDEFLITKLDGRKVTKVDSSKYNTHFTSKKKPLVKKSSRK